MEIGLISCTKHKRDDPSQPHKRYKAPLAEEIMKFIHSGYLLKGQQ